MEDNETASDRIRNRNVVDMLRDDQASGSKKNWKAFRDKLRLKRAGKVWTSSVPIPASDLPIQTNTNRMMMRRGSARYPSDPNVDELDGEANRQLGHTPERQRSRLLPLETDPYEEDEQNTPESEQKQTTEYGNQQAQMSLMSLLEGDGSTYMEDHDEDHSEEHHGEEAEEEAAAEEVAEEEEDIGDHNICCRCRAKHKGTAFGPCGHTFCKVCTKEFQVSRGNCPTCNDYILEILDIY